MTDRRLSTAAIAIGRNEGERLVRCLRSLAQMGCTVVYVDSDSHDGSPALAAAMGARVVALGHDRPFTAARARAEGFAALIASTPTIENVLFIDGDCELSEEFLPVAEQFLKNNDEFGVVCGRRREKFPEASPYNRLIDEEWDTAIGEAESCGGDALFNCRAYQEAGGFDPTMIAGEEPELCARLRHRGWRIMRLDTPMTIHDAAIYRFSQWWGRGTRSGMGYLQAWTKTRAGSALYARELLRAAGWAIALPIVSIALAISLSPWLLLAWPGLAFLQFGRLTRRDGARRALLSIVGKYAEAVGMLRFTARAMVRSRRTVASYK